MKQNDDNLLSSNDQKEHLSIAYVVAVATMAGYAIGRLDIDRSSIDIEIKAGGGMRPAIDVQLKATSTLSWRESISPFSLSRKNYDDLRAQRQTPAILVVLELPSDHRTWLHQTNESLTLKRCAFWHSLAGAPAIDSQTKTVHINSDNVFSVDALRSMMERSRQGLEI